MQKVILKAAILAAWVSMPFALFAQGQSLSLKHGIYVQEGTACKDAPFASMKSWDGIGFAGPHSSKCASRVLTHYGHQYKVSTACSALGDGTPNPSGNAEEETMLLTRLSDTRFALWDGTKAKNTYRWCAAN